MIKKGFNLFTTTAEIVENYKKRLNCSCCTLCTSPYFCVCMAVCKYRSATLGEFIKTVLKGRIK